MKTKILCFLAAMFVFSTWPAHALEIKSAKLDVTTSEENNLIELPPVAIDVDLTHDGDADTKILINSIEVELDDPDNSVLNNAKVSFCYYTVDSRGNLQINGEIQLDRASSTSKVWFYNLEGDNLIRTNYVPGETYDVYFNITASSNSLTANYPTNGAMNHLRFKVAPMTNVQFGSASVTVTQNENSFTQELPASGMPIIDAANRTTSFFEINGFTAQVENAQDEIVEVKLTAQISPTDGGSIEREVSMKGSDMGDGFWKAENQHIDLLSGLEQNKAYFLEFRIVGKTSSGQFFYYDNGGLDYVVRFIPGAPSNERFLSAQVMVVMGDESFTTEMPESNMPEADAGTTGDKFEVNGFRATVQIGEQEMQKVRMYASIYPIEGGDAVTELMIEGVNVDPGVWAAENQHISLLDGLELDHTYRLVFYFEGKTASGDKIYYNNGGENYKVTFTYSAAAQEDVIITKGTVRLFSDIGEYTYTFTSNGRDPQEQVGSVGLLILDEFTLELERQSRVHFSSVSLQYKLYEDGRDGNWNTILSQQEQDLGSKLEKRFSASGINLDVLKDCDPNKDYVLEVMFQVVDDNNKYYFLKPDDRFIRFSKVPQSVRGDVNGDGAVTATDIACVVNVLAGLEDASIYEGRADVTGDGGAVTAADIAAIVNILAGLD